MRETESGWDFWLWNLVGDAVTDPKILLIQFYNTISKKFLKLLLLLNFAFGFFAMFGPNFLKMLRNCK